MKRFFKQKNKGFTRTHTFLMRQSRANNASKKYVCGFTLVETLVAISIFTMSILALLSILAQGISHTNYAKTKTTGLYLAQEGIEYIRNMRDTFVLYTDEVPGNSWNGFKSKLAPCKDSNHGCGFDNSVPFTDPGFIFVCSSNPNSPNGCKLYLDNGNYNATTGNESSFVRKIWMEPISGGTEEVKIFSDVSWTQGSGAYNITLSENLFNWVE